MPGGAFEQVGVQAVVKGFNPYMSKLGTMDKRTKGFGGTLGNLGKTALAMGAGFIAAQASIVGVQTIMSKSIGAAVAYEAQMAEIRALTGATEKDTEELTVAIKDMTREMPKSPQELGAAAYFILSSGIEDATDAAEVLEVAARASTIGLGETASVADALTTVLNAYGKSADEAGQVTDVMIEAVKQGKAEASEFAGVLGRVVPLAAQMGISFEEVAANLATFTLLGVSADEAATGLRQVMASLLKPTEQQVEAMEELGFSAEGLRQQIKDKGLLVTLNDMIEATGGNEAAVARLFPNIRALTSVLGTAGVQMDAYTDILGATESASGNLEEGFGIVADTAKFKMGVAMNELNLMLMELGEEILPALVPAMKAVVFTAQALAGAINAILAPVRLISSAIDATFGEMPSELELVTLKLQDMAGSAELTKDGFVDLAVQWGMTRLEAEKLAANTTFSTQMDVWKRELLDVGFSLEAVEEITEGMATSFGMSASDVQSDIDNMLRKGEAYRSSMEMDVGPTVIATLDDIGAAADDARSRLTDMFRETTAEEAAAEAALADLRLEAGRLEAKTNDLSGAEAARLAKLNDELIPAQEENLGLLRLEKDAVEKHALAQDAALGPMEAWRLKVEGQTAAAFGLDAALRAIPAEINPQITLTTEGFQFDIGAFIEQHFPAITGARHGFHGDVTGPQTFFVEPGQRERVDITPQGQSQPILAPSVAAPAAPAAGGGTDPGALASAVAFALQGLTVEMDGRIVGTIINDRLGDRTSQLGRGG